MVTSRPSKSSLLKNTTLPVRPDSPVMVPAGEAAPSSPKSTSSSFR